MALNAKHLTYNTLIEFFGTNTIGWAKATIYAFLGHPVFFWIIDPPTVFLVEN
jgi:hypothetical protein